MASNRLLIILIISLLFTSCTSPQITGTYKSDKPAYYEYPSFFLNGVRSWSVGQEIILKEDSTFNFNGCYVMEGNWRVTSDTLYLFAETYRFKNDSLNKYEWNGIFPKVPSKPFTYKIDGNSLIKYSERGNNKKTLHRLTKI